MNRRGAASFGNFTSALVFTPIEVMNGVRGEALTECAAPRPGIPATLPSADVWRPWLERLVADHSALPEYAALKYSKSGEVFRARISGGNDEPFDVVCRISRSDGRIHSLLRRPSRAQRNLRRAGRLLNAGIDTAVPLAWIERHSPCRSSWLVTEFVADVVDLDQIVLTLLSHLDRRVLCKVKAGLSEALVELFARLDEARLYHRDLKASNILFTCWDGREGAPRVMLVDLDGLHHRRGPSLLGRLVRRWSAGRRWQPLVRIAASLRDYPSLGRTDFARFLRRYLARVGMPTAEWKARFRRLDREANTYAQRSQHRKSHKLDGFTGA